MANFDPLVSSPNLSGVAGHLFDFGNSLGSLPDTFRQASLDRARVADVQRQQQIANLFPGGFPMTPDGQVDYAAVAQKLAPLDPGAALKLAPDIGSQLFQRQLGGGAPSAALSAPGPRATAPVPTQFAALFGQTEQKYNLPQGYLGITAGIESSYNPRSYNEFSRAAGLFQFVPGTAKEYGIRGREYDVAASTDAAARYAAKNQQAFYATFGRMPTAGELYLMHQQGTAGALALFRNPDSRAGSIVGTSAVTANGGRADMSSRQFVDMWDRRFATNAPADAAPQAAPQVARAPVAPQPAPQAAPTRVAGPADAAFGGPPASAAAAVPLRQQLSDLTTGWGRAAAGDLPPSAGAVTSRAAPSSERATTFSGEGPQPFYPTLVPTSREPAAPRVAQLAWPTEQQADMSYPTAPPGDRRPTQAPAQQPLIPKEPLPGRYREDQWQQAAQFLDALSATPNITHDQARAAAEWAQRIRASRAPMGVRPGETIVDPQTGRTIFQAPGGGRGGTQGTPEGNRAIADGIKAGTLPPTLTGLAGRRGAVEEVLAEDKFDLAKAQLEYGRAQRQVASLNGPQLTRFAGLANSVLGTIEEVRTLSEQLDLSGVPLLNRGQMTSEMQLRGNTPAGQLATRYIAAINTLKEEFATLANSGYAPTEPAWRLSNDQINGNYGRAQLGASLDEIQRLIRYRVQGIPGFSQLGPSAPNRYVPDAGAGAPSLAPPPAAAGGSVPRISSKAQYDALPSGTKFIGDDGRRYTKP